MSKKNCRSEYARLLHARQAKKVQGCSRGMEKNRKKKRCHPFLSEKINSQPVCEQAFLPLRSDRSFVDRRFSAINQASFVHVHVFRGSRRLRHSDFCLADMHGCSVLHTGIAGVYGRYRATERYGKKEMKKCAISSEENFSFKLPYRKP